MNESIKNKIKELFESTPSDVAVGFGKKKVNNQFTGELGFVFNVTKKLPLDQIPSNEILPSSVEVDGIIYKTDVNEGEIKLLVCDDTTSINCYDWFVSGVTPNMEYIRPLKGGIQLGAQFQVYKNDPYTSQTFYGTLGFIGVDTLTSALVGVTNAHVAIQNVFHTIDRRNLTIENEIDMMPHNYGKIYQPYWNWNIPDQNYVGNSLRYIPMYKSVPYGETQLNFNYADAAIFSVNISGISFSESYKQFGLSYTEPMAFATTEELDNLLVSNPPIYSAGRTTGAKEGICGLSINILHYSVPVAYRDNVTDSTNVVVDNCIGFTRTNPDCNSPIAAGDSGSAVIGDFSGTWKILGLAFSGYGTQGIFCRIDEIASRLGIEAWDGTSKPFIDVNSRQTITTTGVSDQINVSCSGKTYWQIGTALYNNPC